MTAIVNKLNCIFLFLFLCLPIEGRGEANDVVCSVPLKVGFNDWAPYAWLNPQGVELGLDVDMLRLVAEYMGCELDFIGMPAKRAHQMLKMGSLDIIMGASYIKERDEYAYFSVPYRNEEIRLFVKSELHPTFSISKWQDIFTLKLRLLVPSFGWYGKDYLATKEELERQRLLVISPNANQSVQMLAYGRGDLLIGDTLALPFIASQYEGVRISPLALLVDSNQIHFMITKHENRQVLLAAVNKAILALEGSGAFAKVMTKWQQLSVAQIKDTSLRSNPVIEPGFGVFDDAIERTEKGSMFVASEE